MDTGKSKKLSIVRSSIESFGNFSFNNEIEEIDDPISAYFKQRCGNTHKPSFLKTNDSGSDSSLGLIDVDNVSLFGDEDENIRFSENAKEIQSNSTDEKKNKRKSDVKPKPTTTAPESELDVQRALAQKALKRLSNKSNESHDSTLVQTPQKRESKVINRLSSKLENVKLTDDTKVEKNWLQPKCSPKTPRYFYDELSSIGGEDEHVKKEIKSATDIRQSIYAKNVSSIVKEIPKIYTSMDLGFESQTTEEQINRFEEDEKKFKLENSGVLHNSRISQFSGEVGGDTSQLSVENVNNKSTGEGKKLSIGQFFNMRSNRVSSLVGSTINENSIQNIEEENDVPSKTFSKSECSFPISEISQPKKPTVRRCVSTYDIKKTPEIPKSIRYSSESCSSNSTAMIQDILAEMESGLSGTQIYDKLMKSYGRREKEVQERNKPEKPERLRKISENNETPKSSKVPKGKDLVKNKNKAVDDLFKESKSLSGQNSVLCVNEEFKENVPVNTKLNETIPKIKSKATKGFYASTPKNQPIKSQKDKPKSDCGKVLADSEGWEPPRVKSIQPTIDLNRSSLSEENDKTMTVNSTLCSSEHTKKNSTIVLNDTLTIESTILAGDLTVLSQRIEDMKEDSVCIVRSNEAKEPVLLTVIQRLASLPKGTVDCSALTPLLRDQFPELLSSLPTPTRDSSISVIPTVKKKEQDVFLTVPNSWIKLPGGIGQKEKVFACADLEKNILVPILNVSKNWLLISIKSVELVHPQGKKLTGVKKNDEWFVLDFVTLSLRETVIPPNSRQSLKVSFKSKLATKLELSLTLNVKELLKGESQTRSLKILVNNVHPENYMNIIPKDPINFGVIADQCFDQRTVQISFDGICELPLTVFIEEDESISGHFILKPFTGHQPTEEECSDSMFHHVFYEGEKQVLEFRVIFRPNVLLKEDSKTQDFKAELVLMLGSKTETDGILRKIPVKASIGFAKFLCNPACSPLVFRASEKGQSITRSFPLKNVGSLPIAFSVWIINKDGKAEEEDDVFVAPKSFYLSRNEEAAINITFNARTTQNCTKRYMMLQIKPNGRALYDVELIGLINSPESRPVSRASNASGSTKSAAVSDSVPIKLLTTTHSLSWTSIALEKESRQTFQIKSLSSVTVSVRVTFKRNTNAFKLLNENGEKVHKLRKVLKPECPCIITVVFRPDVVGTHHTSLIFETNHATRKNMILLSGIGGTPNLYMGNVKPDLNGSKILRLQHSRETNQFESIITIKNDGRIPGFLLIKPGVKDFSLSHELTITPSSVVIPPDTSITIKVSQKLKNDDLQQLLADREISKIATICIITGDEPSRLRIKRLIDCGKLQASERLKIFTESFYNEQQMQLKNFKDPASFENEFLKSLKVYEVAVVVERSGEVCEPSILEETVDEFVTFISAGDNTVVSTTKPQRSRNEKSSSEQPKVKLNDLADMNASYFSTDLLKSSHKRVTQWLETLDCF